MDKDLLEKHKKDPNWAEVICLYSGLFDTQNEREDFVLQLAQKDILLAVECKMTSIDDEEDLVNTITTYIKIALDDFVALATLNKYDMYYENILCLLLNKKKGLVRKVFVATVNINIVMVLNTIENLCIFKNSNKNINIYRPVMSGLNKVLEFEPNLILQESDFPNTVEFLKSLGFRAYDIIMKVSLKTETVIYFVAKMKKWNNHKKARKLCEKYSIDYYKISVERLKKEKMKKNNISTQ